MSIDWQAVGIVVASITGGSLTISLLLTRYTSLSDWVDKKRKERTITDMNEHCAMQRESCDKKMGEIHEKTNSIATDVAKIKGMLVILCKKNGYDPKEANDN